MGENPRNQPISMLSYYRGDGAQEYSRLRSLVFWFAAASALSDAVHGVSRLHLGWQLRHLGGPSRPEVAAVAIVSVLLATQIGAAVSCAYVACGSSRASTWALAAEGGSLIGGLAGWCLSLWALRTGNLMDYARVAIYVGDKSIVDLVTSLPALIVVMLVWSDWQSQRGGMMTPPKHSAL
jgi:hypothetical protein